MAARKDSWENWASGIGTMRDKSRHTKFRLRSLLKPEQCEQLFAGDDLSQTIVSAIVDDGMREGWSLRPKKKEGEEEDPKALERAEEIKSELEEFDASEVLRLGAIWGRCYGKGGLLVIMQGQDPESPLEPGTIVDLVDIERREISPLRYYAEITEAKFGKPELYTYSPFTNGTGTTAVVHESRFVLFGGADTPKRIKAMNEGCDLSVLQAVYDVLQQANGNWGAVCAALADMSQAVIKMRGLIEAVAAGKSEQISNRIQLADQMRSVARALLLDSDGEEFEYAERGALSGVGDILNHNWSRLSAAAKMPVTRLMGISPGGLNATGESDQTNWYDRVRAWQRNEMAPAILSLVGLIDSGTWEVVFPELEKMSPKEEAELRKLTAETDSVYVTDQVLLAEEVFKVRFGSGKWTPGFDGLDASTREKALAKELTAMEENAGKPEVDPNALSVPGATEGTSSGAKQPSENAPAPGGTGKAVPPADK